MACTQIWLLQCSVEDTGISKPGMLSRRGRMFWSGVCFDAPSHIPYGGFFFSENSDKMFVDYN